MISDVLQIRMTCIRQGGSVDALVLHCIALSVHAPLRHFDRATNPGSGLPKAQKVLLTEMLCAKPVHKGILGLNLPAQFETSAAKVAESPTPNRYRC